MVYHSQAIRNQIKIRHLDDSSKLKSAVSAEIYDLLIFWSRSIKTALGDNLVGAYLTGSLTYGDFVETRSDIDLAAVVNRPLSQAELDLIKQAHMDVEKKFSRWEQKIECSYIPTELLPKLLPPQMSRPWWGFGVLYETAPYGNEWIINLYFLWKCSIALLGPSFNSLVNYVDMIHVQEASARDLFQEWEPKTREPEWLKNGHYQSYLILNLCRILYAVLQGEAGSKKTAASWAKNSFPEWSHLIEAAQNWRYGDTMERDQEAIAFLSFTISQVKESGVA